MENGFGSAFVNIFYQGKLLSDNVDSFKYCSSEKDGDDCTIILRFDNRNAADSPAFQEDTEWQVAWGWIASKRKSFKKTLIIYELLWAFDNDNIQLTVSLNAAGYSTKQRTSKQVYTNTSMVEILHNTGKIHGLKTSVWIKGPDGNPIQTITSDELIAEMKRLKAKDPHFFDAPSGASHEYPENLVNGINFRNYDNISQGNKTDKQLLDELGQKQPGGQFNLEATDDELNLKPRNFNQAPIRSYSFADTDGELISFEPESKNKSKNGSGVNLNYDGWDPVTKTYYTGDANVLTDTEKKTLAKYEKEFYNISSSPDDKIVSFLATTKQGSMGADASNRVQLVGTPVTVLDRKKALANTIKYFDPTFFNKGVNDPTATNPSDSLDFANGLRDEANLKMNPGKVEVIGEASLMQGKIITVLGVSKKYSGNYYITKADHDIKKGHYMTTLEVVRQGHNIKTSSAYLPSSETGKTINKTIGSPVGSSKTRILGKSGNP